MKLLTVAIEREFRRVGRQEGKGDDARVVAKFFTPWTNWTWYATEAYWILKDGTEVGYWERESRPVDAVDIHFFGLVVGFAAELGYFALSELEAVRGPAGIRIERDRHLRPTTIAAVRKRPHAA